jgi:hypothetical protein
VGWVDPGESRGRSNLYASNIAPNYDMRINAVTPVGRASLTFRRVVLVIGRSSGYGKREES